MDQVVWVRVETDNDHQLKNLKKNESVVKKSKNVSRKLDLNELAVKKRSSKVWTKTTSYPQVRLHLI
jgi:hypothetical protein